MSLCLSTTKSDHLA